MAAIIYPFPAPVDRRAAPAAPFRAPLTRVVASLLVTAAIFAPGVLLLVAAIWGWAS